MLPCLAASLTRASSFQTSTGSRRWRSLAACATLYATFATGVLTWWLSGCALTLPPISDFGLSGDGAPTVFQVGLTVAGVQIVVAQLRTHAARRAVVPSSTAKASEWPSDRQPHVIVRVPRKALADGAACKRERPAAPTSVKACESNGGAGRVEWIGPPSIPTVDTRTRL